MSATERPSLMDHVTATQMMGTFERALVWRWDCTCGAYGGMLLSQERAEREAAQHLAGKASS